MQLARIWLLRKHRRGRNVLLMLPDLLPTSEAAALLRCTPSTVARMAAAGTLPVAVRAPGERGALLFRRADVERVAAQRRDADLDKWAAS